MIYHRAPDCAFYLGDVRECLAAMPEKSVQAVITSPPYFGLRRYSGVEPTVWGGASDCAHDWQPSRYYTEKSASAVTSEAFSEAGEANADRLKAARWREDSTCACCGAWLGCLGLEPTPEMFVRHLIDVFRSIWRVLRDDGVLFVNLDDSYEDKGMLLVPEQFAIAMRSDGWIVRSRIIWAKRACMPEGSAKDRPTNAHEEIRMFVKRDRYYWNQEAVREQSDPKQEAHNRRYARAYGLRISDGHGQPGNVNNVGIHSRPGPGGRNLRNVWIDADDASSDFWYLSQEPSNIEHFAAFPRHVPRRCILAASREGDTVLDCFGGSGTTNVVARELGRRSVYIDASREYADMAIKRYESTPVALPLPLHQPAPVAEQLALEER